MVTTTRKEDYLGRDLTNEDPGTSNATDHVGRNVKASDKDYLGRDLTSRPWATGVVTPLGRVVYLTTGAELTCTVAGTTHATTEPTEPDEVGATVTDNTVTWTQTELAPA